MALRCMALMAWLAVGAAVAAAATAEDAALDRYYTLRKEGDPQALAVIAEAARRFPSNLTIQLEWGYGALAVKDYEAARTAFSAATRIAPERADLWKQLGYIEITRKDVDAAIAAFDRALVLQPEDTAILLQIGYLEEGRGRRRAAARRFRLAMEGGDADLARRGCEAYGVLRGLPDRMLPDPWFAEFYTAPEYLSHFDVGVLPADARVGVTVDPSLGLEVYGSARMNVDSRSSAGIFGPQLFFDNYAIFAGGARMRPLADVPLVVFAEGGAAYDLVYQDRPRWRGDFRGGAIFYDEWNTALACDGRGPFAVRPVADLYADTVYYTRYDNVLMFARARPGLRVIETPETAVDFHLVAALGWDSRGISSNRYLDLGVGIAFRLYEPTRLTLRGEAVRRLRVDESDYTDLRVLLEYAIRF